jgi:dUTP pyrophosphatase
MNLLFKNLTIHKMNVALLSPDAKLPTRATIGSAGYDLYSPESGTIQPLQRVLLPLHISIQLPVGTYGQVAPRSGLAVKHGIQVGAGIIDEDYRGNVGVLLFNMSDKPFSYEKGDRVAQLIIKSYESPEIRQVEKLEESKRGDGGFGSSGK